MHARITALAAVVALAGCATAPRTAYHTDGSGDYYYGEPAADVVVDSGYYGSPRWGSGGGYSPWGWGGYGFGFGSSYGYGYGYGNGGYGLGYPPWWGYGGYVPGWAIYDPGHPRRGRSDDDLRFRQGGSGRIDRGVAGKSDSVATGLIERPARINGALPSSRYAPAARLAPGDNRGAPLSGIGPRVSAPPRPAQRPAAPTGYSRGPAPSPRAMPNSRPSAPMRAPSAPSRAPSSPSRAPSGKRE